MKRFVWPEERSRIELFFRRSAGDSPGVRRGVEKIIAAVAREGDRAVLRLTARYDGARLAAGQMEIPRGEWKAAWERTPATLRSALRLAARRIRAFHRRQRLRGWTVTDPRLGRMQWRVEPLERVGVYVPGGRAAYPSTVLMNVIPAKAAGVGEVVLATPPGRDGSPAPVVLAAAWLAGADRVFRIGGAQAVAALALGTETIPRVDKIVGPGNIHVATAKRLLFGRVDIDSIAGPTEVLILADETARADWIAADLLAQAEHDPGASAGVVLIGRGAQLLKPLREALEVQRRGLSRGSVAAASLRRNGYAILAPDAAAAAEIANLKAPEHVEIMTRGARRLAGRVRHAGAIFIGPHSPEPLGDYVAGPNHTLPTGGTARFFSPLSVWSFYRTSHAIEATAEGLRRHAAAVECLAEAEGLTAHAESVRVRLKSS